jgi:hypothetical protein
MVIAVEHVGIASTDVVVRTILTATDTTLRKKVGDLPLLLDTVQILAESAKDRSMDLLASAVQYHPDLEDLRKQIGSLPVEQSIALATDPDADFNSRAVATWMACAQEWGHDHRLKTVDLKRHS